MTGIQPIDSAFTGGSLGLVPLSEDLSPEVGICLNDQAQALSGYLPVTVIIMVFTIICIASIRTYVNMIPSFAGCLFRWKENINLEDSPMLCIYRNRIFLVLAVPFCILAASYRLYDPGFLSGLAPVPYFLAVTGVFLAYLGIRTALAWGLRSRKMDGKAYKAAANSFRTFFIIAATVLLVTSGLLEILSVESLLSRRILLVEAALAYAVLLVREAQIFKNYRSVLSAILYLCALEILPTGILVATAIV